MLGKYSSQTVQTPKEQSDLGLHCLFMNECPKRVHVVFQIFAKHIFK